MDTELRATSYDHEPWATSDELSGVLAVFAVSDLLLLKATLLRAANVCCMCSFGLCFHAIRGRLMIVVILPCVVCTILHVAISLLSIIRWSKSVPLRCFSRYHANSMSNLLSDYTSDILSCEHFGCCTR